MKATISLDNAQILIDAIKAIRCIVSEVTVVLDEKGLAIREFDPSRVAMVDFWISKEIMSTFDLQGNKEVRFKIDLRELKKLLKPSNATLTFDTDTLKGSLQQQSKNSQTRAFSFGLLSADSSETAVTPPLKLDFEAEAKMTLHDLQTIVQDAQLCTQALRLTATVDNTIQIENWDPSDMTLYAATLSLENPLLNITVKNNAKSAFGLKFLEDITRESANMAEIVTIRWKTDFPITLIFEAKDDSNTVNLIYALAPRVG